MRLASTALALTAALGLAACEFNVGGAPGDDAAQAADDTATNAATDETPAAGDSGVAIAADSEGLRLVNAETGSTTLLAFGAPRDQAMTAVGNVLGQGDAEIQDECYSGEFAGPVEYVSYDGLTILIHDGAFVGWTADGTSISTMDGVAPGSSLADVEAAGGEPAESSLGMEGEVGGVGFLMNETGDTVSTLYAGSTCFAR